MKDRLEARLKWAALAALVAGAVWLLPRWGDVLPADVAFRIVLGVGWMTVLGLAWVGAGRWLLKPLGERWERDPALVLATGAMALSMAATILAAVHCLLAPVLLVVLTVAALAGCVSLVRGPGLEAPWAGGRRWPWVLLGLPAAIQIVGITAPPVFYDSLNYHLAFPARWLLAGGWEQFPRHAYSYYPAAMGSLSTFALASVGAWGARAIHLLLSLAATLAAAGLARRLAGARAAWWAAALFLLTPSVLQTGPLAVADLGVAAWGGAALLAVMNLVDEPRTRAGAMVAGLLAGCAVGAKYLGGFTVALPVLAALMVAVTGGLRRRLGAAAALAAGGLATAGPWLLRNLLWTGDPVYPYLGRLFGVAPNGMNLAGELAQNTPGSLVALPEAVRVVIALGVRTLHPLQFGGIIGPLWLLLLIPTLLLVRSRRAAPLWAATVVGLVGWGALVQFGRFLLPVLVPFGALAGAAAAELVRSEPRKRLVTPAVVVLLGTLLVWNASAVLDPLQAERLSVVAGAETDTAFIRHWVSYWPAIGAIEELVPPDGKLLLVGESRCYGIPRPVLVEDPYHPPLLVDLAEVSADASDLGLAGLGVTDLLVNREEMRRMARMRGLEEYFAEASPSARARIVGLLQASPLIWREGPLELRELPRKGVASSKNP